MRAACISLILGLVLLANGLRVPVQKAKRQGSELRRRNSDFSVFGPHTESPASGTLINDAFTGDDLGLIAPHDLLYIANITVAGNDYPVQLDTGSSDLWVQAPTTPIPNAKQTSGTLNVTYGIGWAFGHVSLAPVTFAGISIPSQAFLDVSSVNSPVLVNGGKGIVGLGFTSLSQIDIEVSKTTADYGRSLLFNAFQTDKSQPNMISFSLQRSSNPADSGSGTFSIGEYEPAYAAVANEPMIPTWPLDDPSRWTVLMDSFTVGSQTFSVSTNVVGAPVKNAVVLVDSGTSYTYLPQDAARAIYGGVTGAHFSDSLGQWVVPCDAEIDLALQFGGKVYPVHPLDITSKNPTDPTSDWLAGDNFLRSVYSVYDFGDFDSSGNMGNPYIQFLSVIQSAEQASQEFHSARGDGVHMKIINDVSNSTTTGGKTGGRLSSDADDTERMVNYKPAILGLLGLDAIALIIIVAIGICYFIPRRQTGVVESGLKIKCDGDNANNVARMLVSHPPSTSDVGHRYTPVDNYDNYISGAKPQSQGYQQR
ncbi:acid protease [Rickenella mellea]|uniref:Acid protease n=1 Tax=Rickenella mellea TaxID=50990 RepID=A0A4Y7PI64_9AGAM|nr:acid protease [Rickenella mellea]